jgi:hypothetical protein
LRETDRDTGERERERRRGREREREKEREGEVLNALKCMHVCIERRSGASRWGNLKLQFEGAVTILFPIEGHMWLEGRCRLTAPSLSRPCPRLCSGFPAKMRPFRTPLASLEAYRVT